jgi:hypothetical protein
MYPWAKTGLKPVHSLLWLLCLGWLLLLSPASWAERAMLSGELGAWLQQTAIPELTDTLANHPKFKGEPIRVAAVKGELPSASSNALSDAIRQQLTHAVLRNGRNDIANSPDPNQCKKVPRPVHYVVGIQIETVSRSSHRVSLAMLDTTESMWVGGLSLSWQGRLLSSERQALATQVHHAPAGSLENPIALSNHSTLSQLLAKQVQCRLPAGIDGAVLARAPAQPELQLVLQDLHTQLRLSTLTMTDKEAEAAWRFAADVQTLGSGIKQLNLDLVSQDDASQQRLASVYVTGRGGASAVSAASQTLLSDLVLQPSSRGCRTQACSEITFELLEPAHLVVFRTHQTQLSPVQCSSRIPKKQQGEHRYRMQLGNDPDQRIGLYVIASRERGQLDALHRQLRRAPGACGTPQSRDHQRWMDAALSAISDRQHTLQWRAIHLINTPQGAIEL